MITNTSDDKKSQPAKRQRIYAHVSDEVKNIHKEAEKLFSTLPLKQRWIGFLCTISACLETRNGAIVPWKKVQLESMDIWHFTLLTEDAPSSTIEFSLPGFQLEKTPEMLTGILDAAVPSEQYTTQLMMNFTRESGIYSTEFCNNNRATVLEAPCFVCDTKEEAERKVKDWLMTKEGSSFIMKWAGKRILDDRPVETTSREDEEDEFSCMICMDATPSTCVKPCGHVVVCSTCSTKLRVTADKGRCVRCRSRIDSIEDLTTGEVTIADT